MFNSSLLIGISSLLETLNGETDISKLIINNCSYQVFAGCYCVDQSNKIDQILIRYLKSMPNGILLDICLPFHHHPYYGLGRYILFQGKIIAVRVCQSQLWPRYQTVYVPLSHKLQEYYRIRFGKNNYQNKVLFGQFYLSLQNCKIAMFFQSQLRNHCHDRFLEYYRQKCDIYSVINNCSVSQQDLQKYGQSQQSTKLKKQMSLFSFDNNIIISYCGLKGTTNERKIYFSQDLIQQNYNFCRNNNNNNIYQSHYVTMPIIIKQQYYLNNENKENQLYYKKEIQNILFQENFIYEMKLKYKLKNYQQKKQSKQINRNINIITQHSNICLKMYLWYLYRNINKKQPFVIGIPWGKNMKMIFSLLNQIASQVQIQKDQIILLYQKKTINWKNQYAQKYRIKQLPKNKYLYLYEQDLNQIKAVQQSIQFGKVQICRKYIPYFGSNHYRIDKTNKIQVKNNNHKIQFSQQFEGQKCILEHKETKNVKIQCLQCRKNYCYNCMLNKKGSKIPIYQQIEKWKCNNCKQTQQNNQMKKNNSETKEKLNQQRTEDIVPIFQKKNSDKKNNKQIQKDQLDQLKISKKRFKSHSKERFRSRSKEHKKDVKMKKLKNHEKHSQQRQYNENKNKANFNNIEEDKAKMLWNQDLQSNQNNTFCRNQFKQKLIIRTQKINLENIEY